MAFIIDLATGRTIKVTRSPHEKPPRSPREAPEKPLYLLGGFSWGHHRVGVGFGVDVGGWVGHPIYTGWGSVWTMEWRLVFYLYGYGALSHIEL